MKYLYTNLKCSVFPGFYNSTISLDEIDRDSSEIPEGFSWDFMPKCYQKYMAEVSAEWVWNMKQQLEFDNPLSISIGKLDSLWSPHEYNFTTDKITFRVDVNLRKLKEFCWKKNAEDFDKYLYENWADRPGFFSFIANSLKKFRYEYYHGTSYGVEKRDEYVGIMLEYYFLKQIDFNSVESHVWDKISEITDNYICLYRESDNSYWDFLWDNDIQEYIPTKKIA